MRTVSVSYFREGAFAGARPGELFASYSCLACGHREKTWAGFRAHRRVRPGPAAQLRWTEEAAAPPGTDALLVDGAWVFGEPAGCVLPPEAA